MVKDAKQRSRKGPKRKRPLTVDDDLAQLAIVLDEYRLDNNATGWFTIPWRDGWNAIALALDQADREVGFRHETVLKVATWATNKEISAGVYWALSDLLAIGDLHKRRALHAAIRCYQVLIARSDGGGAVYNDILRPIFDDEPITPELEDSILRARCLDALGSNPNPKAKAAFDIAWRRQLYFAAYAIHP